jgi:hypothetical protein
MRSEVGKTMNQKQKMHFIGSIVMNIVLISAVIWGYLKIDLALENLFFKEVQENLVELEGVIANQKENNWSEPQVVINQLDDVLNGLNAGIHTGNHSGWISNEEKQLLESLYSKLSQYPHNEIYEVPELTKLDRKHFEELQLKLKEAGLGLNITIENDWNTFIEKCKLLSESIEVPLD